MDLSSYYISLFFDHILLVCLYPGGKELHIIQLHL